MNGGIREGDGRTFPYRTGAKCPSSIHGRGAVNDSCKMDVWSTKYGQDFLS